MLRPPLVALALGLPLLCLGGPLRAADPATQGLPFPAAPPSSTEGLAGQLAAALYAPDTRLGAVQLAVTLHTPGRTLAAEALTAHLANAFEAALRRRATIGARVAPPEPAEERVEIELLLDNGQISASARRTRLPTNLWDRLAAPAGQVIGTAFTSWPLDLELRTLIGLERAAVRLDSLRVVPVGERTLAFSAAPILDVLIDDLDGDRQPDLIVLQPDLVRVVGWRAGGFSVERARLDLGALPPNPARLRAPLGRLVVVTRPDGTHLLIAATSDRAVPVALALAPGGPLTPLTAPTPPGWPLYATSVDAWVTTDWPRGVDLLTGPLHEVHLGEGAQTRLGALDATYDLRAFAMRGATSPSWSPFLARADRGGALAVWSPGGAKALPRLGTVMVVADLDGDGAAELLTTSDALGPRDRLTLLGALDDPRGPRRTWSIEVKAPVTAAACGDVDRDGYNEFVVATWDGRVPELLIVVPRT